MLSRNLVQTLHRALSLASERRHEYATLEHLLLGLVDDTDAATVLRACGVDLDKLRTDLTEFLDKELSGLATDRPGDPKPTAGFQRVVQRAAIHVRLPLMDLRHRRPAHRRAGGGHLRSGRPRGEQPRASGLR